VKHEELIDRLERKVLGPEGQGHRAVFLRSVMSPDGSRLADAVSLGLWRTRGQHLSGYEVKVRRADWLGELREPAKADALGRYCDRFWLVADKGVLRPNAGEVPETWGIMTPGGGGLSIVRPAPELPAAALPRALLCRMMGLAAKGDHSRALRRLEGDVRAHAEAAVRHRLQSAERAEERLGALEAEWESFRERTGHEFSYMLGWPDDTLRKIADVLLALRTADEEADRLRRQLGNQARRLEEMAALMRRAETALDEVGSSPAPSSREDSGPPEPTDPKEDP